jgi:hypothetical protein
MLRVIVVLAAIIAVPRAQQTPQAPQDFTPPITKPTYERGRGPRVVVDGGHNNLHTVDGGYAVFSDLLRRDGYRVTGSTAPFTDEALRETDVLVIANATAPRAPQGATTPETSAFTDAEAAAVERFVRDGRSLLLVADHEPWPAAAAKVATRLRVEFKNAYAYVGSEGSLTYRKADKTLVEHEVTEGVSSVATFLGSAFRIDGTHVPLMTLGPSAVARPAMGSAPHPQEVPIGGWLQGALLEHGRGRVGVFGEAAMFSAQVRGGRAMGMNAPGAEDNPRFVLNVMRWLGRGR